MRDITTSFITFLLCVAHIHEVSLAEQPQPEHVSRPELRKPLEPSEAAATITAPKGFRVELVAAEPLVHDPMAMEFDENGIAYVLEIPAYNEYSKPKPHTPGSVARLEDIDGDGRFDRRTTFAGDLTYPTGLFCYDGGLFVGDAPNLWYLKDTDGDGISDQRDLLYTGFGVVPAGESRLNSFRWGLDNRIHISTGHDGGDIRAADRPEAPARSVRNRRILLEPRSRIFELTSGGGQHGMSFDDWGRAFVCDNSNPIQSIVYDDRYIQRNPLMSATSAVVNVGPGKHYTKLARISQPENWRLIRTGLLEKGAHVTDTYEYDRPAGVFTSATGVTIYRGDAWPENFRGNAFIGEVVNNLVYQARITHDGLDIESERLGGESGFLASNDTWFRPAQFAHGPDGNLYMIDMYRELIEGIQWVPPEVVAKMDPTAGSDRGRIYRIVPEKYKWRSPGRLGQLSTLELVKQLESRNGWRRDTAARLLYERQDSAAIAPLRELLETADFPQTRMHALYALDGLGALEPSDLRRGFNDPHPRVREHALRLAEKLAHFPQHSAKIVQEVAGMAHDEDVAVRLQAAFSLGEFRPVERMHALIGLLKTDGGDPRFRMAIQSSLGAGAAQFIEALLGDEKLLGMAHVREFLPTLAHQIGRSKDERDLRIVVAAIDDLAAGNEVHETLSKSLVVALLADGLGAAVDDLSAESTGRVKEVLSKLLTNARSTALDQEANPDSRVEAVTILGCGSFAVARPAFDELLSPRQPQPVQEAVMKILGRFSDADVVELLLDKWPSFTPSTRTSVTEVLLSRPKWAEALLSAVERKVVSAGDFDPARVALLKSHPSQEVREKAVVVFAGSSVARRAEMVADYGAALKLAGDAGKGRAVFERTCSNCHALEDTGVQIGADLKSIREKGPEAILLNILDPNREINPKYLSYAATTNDGRVITGMIKEETPNNLTIRQADGVEVPINRIDLEEIESTGMSYMPEGLESQIDHQAMADLLAFLMTAGNNDQGSKGDK